MSEAVLRREEDSSGLGCGVQGVGCGVLLCTGSRGTVGQVSGEGVSGHLNVPARPIASHPGLVR